MDCSYRAVFDGQLCHLAACHKLRPLHDRLFQQAPRIPLGACGASDRAVAAAGAFLRIQQLGRDDWIKSHFLEQGKHLSRRIVPVLLMLRRDRQFLIQLLKLRVEVDPQFPERAVIPHRVSRREGRGPANAFAAHHDHLLVFIDDHVWKQALYHPLIQVNSCLSESRQFIDRIGERLESSAFFQDRHLILSLQFLRYGGAACTGPDHDSRLFLTHCHILFTYLTAKASFLCQTGAAGSAPLCDPVAELQSSAAADS